MSRPAPPRPPDGPTLPVREPPRLVVVGVAMAGAIAVLLSLEQVTAVRDLVSSVDDAAHAWAVRWDNEPALALSRVLSLLGGAIVTTPLRIVVGVAFALQRRWWYVAAWVASIATMEVTVTLMKLGFDRPRPPSGLEPTSMAAFPSGHAAATAVTVTTVLLLLAPWTLKTSRRWWVVGAVVVAAMAASRVYLRVHWLSDVAVGVSVGGAAAVLAVAVVAVLEARRARPRGVRLRD